MTLKMSLWVMSKYIIANDKFVVLISESLTIIHIHSLLFTQFQISLICFPSVVFCTLGTTRAQAGSASRFVEIDKGYVISSAKIIKQQNQDRDIHYLYCSTTGANKNSSFLYPRTKGEIEHELGDVGFKRVTIFRPGFLKVEEERTDRGSFEKYVVGAAIGFMKLVGSKGYVDVATVGKGNKI